MFIAALFTYIYVCIICIGTCIYVYTCVCVCNGILLTMKRSVFDSVLMRWMNLEPIRVNKSEKYIIY